jgi:para-nitrobenzyl esterase
MYTMGQPMILNMDEATLRQRMLETPGATPKVVDRVLAAYKKQYPKATPWERYIDITSDTGFGITSIRIAELKAAQGGAPVYLYRFDYETTKLGGHIRSMHGTEIPFVFNNIKNTAWMVDDTPETNALAAHMSAAWAAFARTGNPNTGALPEWPTFDTKSRSTMIFNLTSRVEHDPEHDARVSVEQLAPRS